MPFLRERPSHYLKQYYYGTQPIEEPHDPAVVAKIVELYDGATKTLFASDWPHHDFDHPMKLAQVPFDAETRARIFGKNALELFNLRSDRRAASQEMNDRRRHRVGEVEDFPPGRPHLVRVGGREIGIFNIDGRLHGLPNLCPHQTGPLCEAPSLTGTLQASPDRQWRFEWVHDGEIVRCPWHGLEFHVPTGQCLAFREIVLRRYEIVVEDGMVIVLV